MRLSKEERNRILYQADLWPAACEAQGWDPRDKDLRRDHRAKCWEAIGQSHLGNAMPRNDHQTTALFTYLRHLADPNNINLLMAWENCQADFVAYNIGKQSDHHQRKPGRPRYYRDRATATGNPLEDPLDRKAATHRLIRMRTAARKTTLDPNKNFKGREAAPSASVECPF